MVAVREALVILMKLVKVRAAVRRATGLLVKLTRAVAAAVAVAFGVMVVLVVQVWSWFAT